ncbi:hypothetical protein [Tistlia sp.]|uniref:aldose epimerase family protein n=1 Tax=Tistlia sp. TaxID=3057121 RepID=UPI0034A23B66
MSAPALEAERRRNSRQNPTSLRQPAQRHPDRALRARRRPRPGGLDPNPWRDRPVDPAAGPGGPRRPHHAGRRAADSDRRTARGCRQRARLGELSAPAARVLDPESGRRVELYTSEPGVQFYTANFLDGLPGPQGRRYDRWGAFTLEAQHFSPFHRTSRPSPRPSCDRAKPTGRRRSTASRRSERPA